MSDRISKFESSLTKDFARRTRRLVGYENIFKCDGIFDDFFMGTILRGATVELCSQWEGFCKKSIKSYIEFINHQVDHISDLRVELRTIEAVQQILGKKNNIGNGQPKKFRHYYNDIFVLLHEPDRSEKKRLSTKFLDEQSSIDWAYFEELMWVIGISVEEVKIYRNALNELIGMRNGIAHGEDYVSHNEDLSIKLDLENDLKVWKEKLKIIQIMMKYVFDEICVSVKEERFLISYQNLD